MSTYRVHVSKLCYGEVVVDADSPEDAINAAAKTKATYYDEEVTDMTAEEINETSSSQYRDGYRKEEITEPLIWEPEDWSPAEWATLCRVCGLPADRTQRIVLHADTIESYIDSDEEPVHAGQVCEITEVCPHCESEITMIWDVASLGHKAFCPVCGKRLMLCDMCQHSGPDGAYVGGCDYDSQSDSCHFNPPVMEAPAGLRVETPLGAIIARDSGNSDYPGIWLDLRRPDVDFDMPLALVECISADDEGNSELVAHIWGNAMQDDQTEQVVYKGIEDFFKIEED